MKPYIIILILSLFLLAKSQEIFHLDVTNNIGKIFSGVDITKGISKAWNKACASTSPSKVVVPKGIFKLKNVTLQGPCKAPIEFNIQGIMLQAPPTNGNFTRGDAWVAFEYIEFLTISGTGIFDGQGKPYWGKQCAEYEYCGNLPINIRFNYVMNSIVQEVTSLDSKQFHINVLGCKNLTFQHIKIIADKNSLNTDGIHIGRSANIKVLDSNIQTGDDCVSIGDGSKKITILNVVCGPGHGIIIGSLGKYPNELPVKGVYIKGCTLKNTQNGVRIKTWPNSKKGSASNMRFEDIIMENVANPVLIDQEYCPWNRCSSKIVASRVQISDVSFKNIRGTSSTALAVKLVCSSGLPCQNVNMTDINLKYTGKDKKITSECKNVKLTVAGVQKPPACVTNSTTH